MAAGPQAERRGPRLGDAASLWNFTAAPGWTKEEANVLKLCLMVHGVGRWQQILETGLLPGKTIQQCNGQTQRLLGQQSLAAYTGLHVDLDRIRNDNALKTDAERKSGLIIWAGNNPTKDMKERWQRESQAEYGLSAEQLGEVEAELAACSSKAAAATSMQAFPLMDGDPAGLSKAEKVGLLVRLRKRLAVLAALLGAARLQAAGCSPAAVLSPRSARRPQAAKAEPAEQPVKGEDPACKAEEQGDGEEEEAREPPKRAKRAAKPSEKRRKAAEEPPAPQRKRRTKKGPPGPVEEDAGETGGGAPMDTGAASAAQVALAEDVASLVAMGFERQKAREALEEAGGDVAAATEWLVTHCL